MTRNPGRLPDFMIIGTMKSGSTTLFRWLDDHPGVSMPQVKEPNFFSDDRAYSQGLGSYQALFAVPPDKLTGEASVEYTDPQVAGRVARRVQECLPAIRLICVLRDPLERMRSHYRHEVQRGRERRPFPSAVERATSPYVRRSCYASALAPWVDAFGADRLHVDTSERLFATDDATSWQRLLAFLDLPTVDPPRTVFNESAGKLPYSPLMRRLWDRGLVQRAPALPKVVRRAARPILLRPHETTRRLTDSARAPIPEPTRISLAEEVTSLDALLPRLKPGWKLTR